MFWFDGQHMTGPCGATEKQGGSAVVKSKTCPTVILAEESQADHYDILQTEQWISTL